MSGNDDATMPCSDNNAIEKIAVNGPWDAVLLAVGRRDTTPVALGTRGHVDALADAVIGVVTTIELDKVLRYNR